MACLTGLIRFRAVVIVCVALATAFALGPLPHLRFETDTEALSPMSDPVQADNTQVEDLFESGDPLIVGVISENPAKDSVCNPHTLRIVRELSTHIVRLLGIKDSGRSDVANVATLDNISCTHKQQGGTQRDSRL